MMMTDNVIEFRLPSNQGNGGREALIGIIVDNCEPQEGGVADVEDFVDMLLTSLWCEGYKVVPLKLSDDVDEPIEA